MKYRTRHQMIQILVIFHFEVVFDQNFEEKLLVAIDSIQHFDDLSVAKTIDLQKRYFVFKTYFVKQIIGINLDRADVLVPLMP